MFAARVITRAAPATSANLTTTIPAQTAYVSGLRLQTAAEAHLFTASRDTYVDIGYDATGTGVLYYTEVANNAPAPAIGANRIRLFRVVTGASSVTSVADLRTLPQDKQVMTYDGTQGVYVPGAGAVDKLTVADNYADYVVDGLLASAALPVALSPGLSIPAGNAYVNGTRLDQAAIAARAYTASRDTYVDLSASGTVTYVEVANNAAEPALTPNSIRLFKVVTSATQITSIVDMRPPNPFSSHKQGLGLVWVAGNTLRVTPGSAYIPAENKVVHFPVQTDIAVSFPANSTAFHYVYLYRDPTTGRGAIELSTTVPSAPYMGGAKTKSGDISRRYLGSVRPNGAASPAMYAFIRTFDGITQYRENLYHTVAPFSIANGIAPAAGTVVPLGQTGTSPLNLVPAQCRIAFINVYAQASAPTTMQASDDSLTDTANQGLTALGNAHAAFRVPLNPSQQFTWQGATTYAYLWGYLDET